MATVKLDPAKGIQIPNLTTTERNAISSPETGAIIWNTTTSEINQYNGSAWEITYTPVAGISSSADATAITINSSEQVGIGKTPVNTLDVNHSGGAIVKLWRDSSSGYLQFDTDGTNSHIKNGGGPIKFKTGGDTVRASVTDNGICFGTDTAAANALDDYEYGTWTPTFYLNHIGSHTLNYANYVKVGRLVTINMYVYNFGSIGGTGISFGITNLPFSQNVQALGVVTATHTDFHNYYGHAVARLYNGVAYIEQTRDATGGHWLDYSAFNANSHVQMSIAYETSV